MQTNHLNGDRLRAYNLLARILQLHDRLFELDLFLKQVFYLLDVVDVVFVDMQVTWIPARPLPLLFNLLHELSLVVLFRCLTGLFLPLLGFPMVLVSLDIIPELGCFLTTLNLALIFLLTNLFHEIILQRSIRR